MPSMSDDQVGSKLEAHPSPQDDHRKPSSSSLAGDPTSEGAANTNDYPIGAVKAWSTVLGAWLIQFCSVGVLTSFGVFQAFNTTTWLSQSSASDISWIGSVQLFLELACGPIGGKLFDAGHCRITVLAGSVLFLFSFFMISLAKPNQYYQLFLSQGVGMGLGCSLIFLPTTSIVTQHFKSRRGLAMGIVVSSGCLGGVIFSIMLNKLINGPVGFAWAVRAAAFLALGLILAGNMLLFPVTKQKSTYEAEFDGEKKRTAPLWDRYFVIMLPGAFLCSLGLYFPLFYLQLFAELHGIDKNLAFYSLAILNASGMFGRILPGHLADLWGPMNVFIVCLALNGVIGFAMLGAKSAVGLVLFAIFYGFFFGATISVFFPAVLSLGTEDVDVGKRVGIALMPVGLAYLIGSPISGAILGSQFQWWKGITFGSVSMIASVGILVVIKVLQHQALRKTSSNDIEMR